MVGKLRHEVGCHSQRSERLNASSAEAAGGASAANLASSMVPNYIGGEVVTGLSHQAARNVVGPGEMRCDELCTAAGVGTLVERVGRACGDGPSAAVVAFVALAMLGE